MARWLRCAALYFDSRAIEVMSGVLLTFAWGGVLMLPYDTFTSNVAFRALAATPPYHETAWGFIFACVGLCQWRAALRPCQSWRSYAAILAFAAWAFLSVMFALTTIRGIVWVVYGGFALFNFWAIWRARRG